MNPGVREAEARAKAKSAVATSVSQGTSKVATDVFERPSVRNETDSERAEVTAKLRAAYSKAHPREPLDYLNSMTLLHLAASLGELSVVRELLDAPETVVDARNEHGSTPLMFAADNGHVEICNLLLDHRANINAKNKHEMTPLACAVDKKQPACVRELMRCGADQTLRDLRGWTPLVAARNAQSTDLVRLLTSGYSASDKAAKAFSDKFAAAVHIASVFSVPFKAAHSCWHPDFSRAWIAEDFERFIETHPQRDTKRLERVLEEFRDESSTATPPEAARVLASLKEGHAFRIRTGFKGHYFSVVMQPTSDGKTTLVHAVDRAAPLWKMSHSCGKRQINDVYRLPRRFWADDRRRAMAILLETLVSMRSMDESEARRAFSSLVTRGALRVLPQEEVTKELLYQSEPKVQTCHFVNQKSALLLILSHRFGKVQGHQIYKSFTTYMRAETWRRLAGDRDLYAFCVAELDDAFAAKAAKKVKSR